MAQVAEQQIAYVRELLGTAKPLRSGLERRFSYRAMGITAVLVLAGNVVLMAQVAWREYGPPHARAVAALTKAIQTVAERRHVPAASIRMEIAEEYGVTSFAYLSSSEVYGAVYELISDDQRPGAPHSQSAH